MANTDSAKKNARKNEICRVRNSARRSALKTAIKKLFASLDTGKATTEVDLLLSDVASKLGRAKGKGVMHRNAASRKLSRLAKRVAVAKRASAQAQPSA